MLPVADELLQCRERAVRARSGLRRLADDARALHTEVQRNGVPARGLVKLDVPPLALTVLKRFGVV